MWGLGGQPPRSVPFPVSCPCVVPPRRLRALSGGGGGVGVVTSPPPSPALPRYQLAENRYGREEMLALYVPGDKVGTARGGDSGELGTSWRGRRGLGGHMAGECSGEDDTQEIWGQMGMLGGPGGGTGMPGGSPYLSMCPPQAPQEIQEREFAAIAQEEPLPPLALLPLTQEEQVGGGHSHPEGGN